MTPKTKPVGKTGSPDTKKPVRRDRDEGGRFLLGAKRKAGPGRPKGSVSVTNALKRIMASRKRYSADEVALAALRAAITGDMRAIEYVTDRLDGKVTQTIDLRTMRDEAEKLAEQYGLTVDEVMAEAKDVLNEARGR